MLPGILVPLDVNSETGAIPIAFVVNGFCSIKEAIFFLYGYLLKPTMLFVCSSTSAGIIGRPYALFLMVSVIFSLCFIGILFT